MIMFIVLNLSGALIWSFSFEGRCGFLSEPCGFGKYFIDNLLWVLIISINYSVLLFLVSGVGGSIAAYKFRKPIKWVYIANILLLIIFLIIITFDPLELF